MFWIFGFLDIWIFGFLDFLDFWIFGFLDFWIFGFLDFWSFGILEFLCFTLVFSICRNSSKIGFGKNGVCTGIYSVFKGVRVVGGVTIYICIHTHAFWAFWGGP